MKLTKLAQLKLTTFGLVLSSLTVQVKVTHLLRRGARMFGRFGEVSQAPVSCQMEYTLFTLDSMMIIVL